MLVRKNPAKMSIEFAPGLPDPLNTLRKIAEDPFVSSDPAVSAEITLSSAKLIAEEVITRKKRARADRGLSLAELTSVGELLDSHPELRGESTALLEFLKVQTEFAQLREQSAPQSPQDLNLALPGTEDPLIEKILSPSRVSVWLSRQERLPFRSKVADLVEDIKLSAVAPFLLARGIGKLDGLETGRMVAVSTVLFHAGVGLSAGMLSATFQTGDSVANPGVGVLAAAASYMLYGYVLYRPGSKNIAPYRQELNNP